MSRKPKPILDPNRASMQGPGLPKGTSGLLASILCFAIFKSLAAYEKRPKAPPAECTPAAIVFGVVVLSWILFCVIAVIVGNVYGPLF